MIFVIANGICRTGGVDTQFKLQANLIKKLHHAHLVFKFWFSSAKAKISTLFKQKKPILQV